MFPSNILTIASPDFSSINETFTLISLCSFVFHILCSFGKIGNDLFKNLEQQSLELITPSNSNTFLIPNTRSTFCGFLIPMCISQVYAHVCVLSQVLWIEH